MSDHEEETPLAPPFGDQVPRGPRTRTRARTEEEVPAPEDARTEEEVPALRDTLEVVEPGTEEPIRPGALVAAGDAPLVDEAPLVNAVPLVNAAPLGNDAALGNETNQIASDPAVVVAMLQSQLTHANQLNRQLQEGMVQHNQNLEAQVLQLQQEMRESRQTQNQTNEGTGKMKLPPPPSATMDTLKSMPLLLAHKREVDRWTNTMKHPSPGSYFYQTLPEKARQRLSLAYEELVDSHKGTVTSDLIIPMIAESYQEESGWSNFNELMKASQLDNEDIRQYAHRLLTLKKGLEFSTSTWITSSPITEDLIKQKLLFSCFPSLRHSIWQHHHSLHPNLVQEKTVAELVVMISRLENAAKMKAPENATIATITKATTSKSKRSSKSGDQKSKKPAWRDLPKERQEEIQNLQKRYWNDKPTFESLFTTKNPFVLKECNRLQISYPTLMYGSRQYTTADQVYAWLDKMPALKEVVFGQKSS